MEMGDLLAIFLLLALNPGAAGQAGGGGGGGNAQRDPTTVPATTPPTVAPRPTWGPMPPINVSACLEKTHYVIALDSCFTTQYPYAQRNYTEARRFCEGEGGRLAAPYTAQALDAVAANELKVGSRTPPDVAHGHGTQDGMFFYFARFWVNAWQQEGERMPNTGWRWSLPDGTDLLSTTPLAMLP